MTCTNSKVLHFTSIFARLADNTAAAGRGTGDFHCAFQLGAGTSFIDLQGEEM